MTSAEVEPSRKSWSCRCQRQVTHAIVEITQEQPLAGPPEGRSSLGDPVVEVDDSAAGASLME